ncbi:MAG TPA: hypothetical protein IGS53_10215 [Leptolyngbyaceae cyanobacterium M33_DOE_097]|nr:hypothetical protein [Leptolyngbyaceae cyanobacterium M33_DOE_097]
MARCASGANSLWWILGDRLWLDSCLHPNNGEGFEVASFEGRVLSLGRKFHRLY